VTVYFYIVEHSQAELCQIRDAMFDDRDELMRHGVLLTFGGCGNARNRVEVGLSPLTPEAIAYMRARYDGPIDYRDGGSSALGPVKPPAVDDVRLVAVRSEDELGLLTCGRRPFPPTAMGAAPADLSHSGPELEALRESLAISANLYGDLASLDWKLAEADMFGATFIADRGDTWLEAPVLASTDGWVPATISYCSPRPLTLADGGSVDLYLDPEFPAPAADTIELHLLVHETGCTGARSPAGWLLPAVANYEADELRLAVYARADGGFATCPGNPSLPVTIVLPEPLGDRELVGLSRPEH
jgi:hypothetical protein